MKKVLLTLAALLPIAAHGAPSTLKCESSNGEKMVDLYVDLAAHSMTWSKNNYAITSVTDAWITGISQTKNNEIGGEVWVLDRSTGEFKRALVFMSCGMPCKGPSNTHLTAAVYTGRCSRPLL